MHKELTRGANRHLNHQNKSYIEEQTSKVKYIMRKICASTFPSNPKANTRVDRSPKQRKSETTIPAN